ncbi:MAG TPA: stage V sporulation protein S [Candidatus Ozemobacteraceae bacterium]|nr:stage V sporulation protein S [Candidatus Ozemobacteraceae bacterium]OQA08445.1 MAG: Stage V sporulation protein S [bacterium ADurb.Bin374]HOT30262.1 stage V sporulation protein S [Candidatus Ozemobacteraceae bacterium]HOY66871.1 stage V sporulation protein S [Candidatus Ozemobacteraceae bacterium]HQG27565.1 stage V sporulation protein S [Candidatus Ozemobacteraceae bacterium]
MEVLRVASSSNPKSVAGAIAAVLEHDSRVELLAVGAGAVNQTVKAIAVTRGYVAPKGIELVTIIAFAKIDIDGNEKTAIKFIVEAR